MSDDRTYLVVRNDQDQYSVWLADRPLPAGWHTDGTSGSKQACLDHIEAVWVDIRPRDARTRIV